MTFKEFLKEGIREISSSVLTLVLSMLVITLIVKCTSGTSHPDATIQTAQQQPPPPPPKPQWYWVGSSDQHATDYKWRLQYYANNHMDSTTKHIVSDLNDMRIGVSTYGDYGGHIADATAPLDFANGEATRMKLDTLLQLMRQKCVWSYYDSLQAAIKLIRDHPELVETKGKNPKQGKQH